MASEQYVDLLNQIPERVAKLIVEMETLHKAKSHDYGSDVDPLANVKAAAEFDVPNWIGVMIRANDKMSRIKQFAKKREVRCEAIRDSFIDLAAYALIALCVMEEE